MKAFLFIFAVTQLTQLAGLTIAHADVESTIATCVKAYSGAIEATVSEETANIGNIKTLCLSPKFRKAWRKIIDESGADPWLKAQDTYPSWKTTVSVKAKGPLTYTVVMGKGHERYCLVMTVDGDNKIDSSRLCDNQKI